VSAAVKFIVILYAFACYPVLSLLLNPLLTVVYFMRYFRFTSLYTALMLAFAIVLVSVPASAQALRPSLKEPDEANGLSMIPVASPTVQQGSLFPTDNVVSAEHYFIGPGDILLVQIVGPISGEYPFTVTPESTILLPRLGEVSLVGKTLAEAKREVQKLVQSRNSLNKAFLTLQRPRSVYVRITGNVVNQGLYTLPASMKVSTAVQLANQAAYQGTSTASANKSTLLKPITPSEEITSLLANKRQYAASVASRNTKVLHRNGTSEISDLVRATVLNSPADDPLVREGDEIYVPSDNESFGMVSVSGAVQRPSILPWRKGDKLSFLLKAGYGLTETADSAGVQVMDAVSAGANQATTLRVQDILSGRADREVQAGVSLLVKAVETAQQQASVSVLGEVKFPGVYPIGAGGLKLKAAVALAGGLTGEAHLPLSSVTRREALLSSLGGGMNSQLESYRNFQYSSLTAEDTARYSLDAALKRPTAACDFVAAFEKNSEVDNITLQDGDVIVIAHNPRNVFVFGQVNKPGYIAFTPNTTAEQYIQRAGGMANGAESGKTRIIKAGSRLWIEPNNTKGELVTLEAGDQIYVPRMADSVSDLGLRRAQVASQKESNEIQRKNLELQETNRVWTIVGTMLGFLTALANVVVIGLSTGVIK
jgi:protein involved in polysaccharide export with SLBB domain